MEEGVDGVGTESSRGFEEGWLQRLRQWHQDLVVPILSPLFHSVLATFSCSVSHPGGKIAASGSQTQGLFLPTEKIQEVHLSDPFGVSVHLCPPRCDHGDNTVVRED